MTTIFKIKNYLLYGGLSRENYKKIQSLVLEENRRNLTVFSFFAFLAFFFAMAMHYRTKAGMGFISLAIVSGVFLLISFCSGTIAKKHEWLTGGMVHIFLTVLLATGVYAGVSQPTARTTILLTFFLFCSVLFSERLITTIILIGVTESVYLILIAQSQLGEVLRINTINSLIFSTLGIMTATYIMTMRFRKHEIDYLNRYLLERDSLTDTYNRRQFDLELERVKQKQEPVAICAFDINGLKATNDKLGHAAGDELILGAAECIKSVFGPYGKVFRAGGDEFAAILDQDFGGEESILKKFKEAQAEWRGEYSDELNISFGMAVLDRNYEKLLDETLRKADLLMYEDKRNYYQSKGLDRRNRQSD